LLRRGSSESFICRLAQGFRADFGRSFSSIPSICSARTLSSIFSLVSNQSAIISSVDVSSVAERYSAWLFNLRRSCSEIFHPRFFRQTINQGGELITKQPALKLVPVGPHYKTKASVRELAQEHLEAINRQNRSPDRTGVPASRRSKQAAIHGQGIPRRVGRSTPNPHR